MDYTWDSSKPLFELSHTINIINTANGWDVPKPKDWDATDPHKVPAILALIHSEISEALEGFRKRDRANFEEELADALIRILDCTYGMNIDIDKVVADKLEKNRKRGYRHGGKVV